MKIAKSRQWGREEVQAAKRDILKKKPGLWERLKEIEVATGDFSNLREWHLLCGVVAASHPECEGNEITDMVLELRKVWSTEIGSE